VIEDGKKSSPTEGTKNNGIDFFVGERENQDNYEHSLQGNK
jgi:hypothetical protein